MRDERGFTLLEVLIAVAIMAMGIVGALELFTGSMRLAGDADRQSQAAILARSLVDEEMWRDVLEENQRSGTEGRFSWNVVTRPIDRELVGRDEEKKGGLHDLSDKMGLWLIQAEVTWEGPSGPKSLEFETARIGHLPDE